MNNLVHKHLRDDLRRKASKTSKIEIFHFREWGKPSVLNLKVMLSMTFSFGNGEGGREQTVQVRKYVWPSQFGPRSCSQDWRGYNNSDNNIYSNVLTCILHLVASGFLFDFFDTALPWMHLFCCCWKLVDF